MVWQAPRHDREHEGDRAAARRPSKAELTAYYLGVRERMEPHIVGRLVRLVDETGPLTTMRVEGFGDVLACVQTGALELDIGGSRIHSFDWPDRMVFDLEPGEDVGVLTLQEAAIELAEYLEESGLGSFVMTTGGRDLQLIVPLGPHHRFVEVRAYVRAWARRLAIESPHVYTAHANRAARKGRIFVDHLHNGRMGAAICPYSPRALPGAAVATPLGWEALGQDLDPGAWGIDEISSRLAESYDDPWAGYFDLAQRITKHAWREVENFR